MNTKYTDKRVGGIKAKYIEYEDSIESAKEQALLPAILVISPCYRRVALLLDRILYQNRKQLTCTGVDLYRQAFQLMQTDLSSRLVALIITDFPDDRESLSTEQLPMWKSVVSMGQRVYLQAFAKEIEEEVFPRALTVITLFHNRQGKLADHEVEYIAHEFYQYLQQNELKHHVCPDEEGLPALVNREVLDVVVQKYRQVESIRQFERTRTQKIARARKMVDDAHRKFKTGAA